MLSLTTTENQYDRNAVAGYITNSAGAEVIIGHLSRQLAVVLSDIQLDQSECTVIKSRPINKGKGKGLEVAIQIKTIVETGTGNYNSLQRQLSRLSD